MRDLVILALWLAAGALVPLAVTSHFNAVMGKRRRWAAIVLTVLVFFGGGAAMLEDPAVGIPAMLIAVTVPTYLLVYNAVQHQTLVSVAARAEDDSGSTHAPDSRDPETGATRSRVRLLTWAAVLAISVVFVSAMLVQSSFTMVVFGLIAVVGACLGAWAELRQGRTPYRGGTG